jgi:hypothetical protein
VKLLKDQVESIDTADLEPTGVYLTVGNQKHMLHLFMTKARMKRLVLKNTRYIKGKQVALVALMPF